MKIINLMPIPITYAPDGDMSRAIVIPKSGYIAKLETGEQVINVLETEIGDIPVFQQPKWGELSVYYVQELLDDYSHVDFDTYTQQYEGEDVLYLVNAVVAQELAGRTDVITPAVGGVGVIRDNGRVVAVTQFNQFV